VLSVLVRVVTEDVVDAGGVPASHLRPKLLELFGHITAKVTNNADIWRLYAELLATSDSLTDTLPERVSRNYLNKNLFLFDFFNGHIIYMLFLFNWSIYSYCLS